MEGYTEGVCGGGTWRGYTERYVEGYMEGYAEGVCRGGTWRGMWRGKWRDMWGASLFVHSYHWLPLATIDLVGDNRELDSLRHIMRSYTHYGWLLV